MKNETITTDDLIAQLLEVLNDKYRVEPLEEYEIPPFGQFGSLEQNPNEIAIELPDGIVGNQAATRAIKTLLWRSGSHALWTGSQFTETDPYRTPLRFALLKRTFWVQEDWQWVRYLVIDHIDEEVDVEAGRRQIGLLVAYLRDTSNLVELGPDDLAMF